MNDRMLEALAAAGLDTTPLSLLDHASAQAATLFALYDQELVYLEGAKSSRVALRDVTRIHSDREGVLRVETSAQTAVTASLLGYDPGRVQTFFQQVRDVTARAKELPVLPLSSKPTGVGSGAGAPTPSGSGLSESRLPGSSMPSVSTPSASMPGVSAYTPAFVPDAAVPVAVPAVAPVVIAPVPLPASTLPAAPQMPTPAQDGLSGDGPGVAASSAAAPATGKAPPPPSPASALMPAGAIHAAVPRPEPVVISSMPPVSALPAFQERAGERNRQANKAASVVEVPTSQTLGTQRTGVQELAGTRTSTESQAPSETQVSRQAPASAVRGPDVPASGHTQGPLVSVSALGGAQDTDLRSELLRRADGVGALARTVGLLALVLGLAALGLAYFQWNAGTSLSAIWTLLTGGVGTVALLAFAEALRLLSALARSQQA